MYIACLLLLMIYVKNKVFGLGLMIFSLFGSMYLNYEYSQNL